MMRVGCNTGAGRTAIDDPRQLTVAESIAQLHEAGFASIDLGLSDVESPDNLLFAEDWERKVEELGELAAKLGIRFSQLHVPFVCNSDPDRDKRFRNTEFISRFEEGVRRAYIAGGRLGIPWAVAHPLTPADIAGDTEKCREYNHEYYDRFVELGISHGVGTAFENMIRNLHIPTGMKVRYCADCEELIGLVDSFCDPKVGVCWDTGHANITGLNQCEALSAVGKRLKVVHLNDNFEVGDHHLAPFVATVDWRGVIQTMASIGYEGEINLEISGYLKHSVRGIQSAMLKSAYASGDQLRRMFSEAAGK